MGSTQFSLVTTILVGLLRLLQYFVSSLLSLYYRGPPQTIPTLTNSLLIISATELAHRIRQRKVTSKEVIKLFIDRIQQINPILNCVVDQRFEDALADAAQVDLLLASGTKTIEELEAETPLLGVPFTTKNGIAVKGMIYDVGLWVRRGKRAEEDSEVVALLRKAGAIPLALTNGPELNMWWESSNHVYGTTCNPYDTRRIPGGSSGGEGSVLASAGSPLGIGSDLFGGIRTVACFNGIFGHKPSAGVVSLERRQDLPNHLKAFSSIGAMSRFSEDLTTVHKLLSNKKLKLDDKVDLKKLKYYFMYDNGGSSVLSPVDSEIKGVFEKVAKYFKRSHNVTVERVDMWELRQQTNIVLAKLRTDGSPFMPAAMAGGQQDVNVWSEALKVALRVSKHTAAAVFVAIIEALQPSRGSFSTQESLRLANQLNTAFENLLRDDGVFFYPTHPTFPTHHNESLLMPFNFTYTAIFNVLGLPATHCPLGISTSRGLPLGLQVVSAKNQDRYTLVVAAELERAFGGWVPPLTHSTNPMKKSEKVANGHGI